MNFSVISLVLTVDQTPPTPAQRRQRGDAHRAFASSLGLYIPSARPPAKTVNLPSSLVSGQPSVEELRDTLGLARAPRRGLYAVLDFGTVDFVTLRETFLDSLGFLISQMVLENPPQTVLVVLFSRVPPRDSLFWRHLDRHNGGDGLVVVAAPSVDARIIGGPWKVNSDSIAKLAPSAVATQGGLIDGLKDRAVRHLGHFDIDGSSCSQYRWEASYSSQFLAGLIEGRISREREDRPRSWRTWIAIPADSSPWLVEACVLAADRVGADLKRVAQDARPVARQEQVGVYIILDVVSRGNHLNGMRSWAGRMPGESVTCIAVFCANDYTDSPGQSLTSLMKVPTSRVPRDSCPQCAIGLPFMNTSQRSPLGIRTFDMWTMMREAVWDSEKYGPSSQTATWDRAFPRMEDMLRNHGPWVACKLQDLMDHVAGDRAVAIVAPDEPAIRYVLRRLPSVLEGLLVPVFVDRTVLDLLEEDSLADPRVLDEASEWGQQLDFFASRGTVAVVYDEFMSSGSTFRAMRRLLSAYNLPTFAFLPVINRSRDRSLDGTPVYSLYELPWKRGERLP